jgi:phosphoglycerol transferase MdoB-like AlkP superfamily enzyme
MRASDVTPPHAAHTTPSWGRRALTALSLSIVQSWALTLALATVLGLLRIAQIAWHWPQGLPVSMSDLAAVVYQGTRFDLKVCASAALLLWPLFIFTPQRVQAWLAGIVAVLFVLANLINLHYFGFYKTTIDPVVFGFFEDDTGAILKTIWSDFPVTLTLITWGVASWGAMALRRALYNFMQPRVMIWLLRGSVQRWLAGLAVVLALLLLILTVKGTLRAMALGRQNVTVTTTQFLNDMVPNGITALKFAWDGRRDSQNFSDPLVGLKRLGYNSPLEAARAIGLPSQDEAALRAALIAHPENKPKAAASNNAPRKNLLFFLMESWSAEPFLYHDEQRFNVLGRLAPTLQQACHFDNFDSAQPGTHPALEALLYSSPITPLTLGLQGKKPIPWALPRVMKNAGYHTLFLTSTTAGWRELDKVLKIQGFDEVVDASHLHATYPEADIGIWGVFDEYLFRYLSQRMKSADPSGDGKPLFVFVLTASNHPPYDLPASYPRVQRDHSLWKGETNSDTLWPNIDTYHYATDQLGGLVQQVQNDSQLSRNTVIAATGDHNVRSFGLYATPERRHLITQVPFVIWGAGAGAACGPQLHQPANHRDMFPTLLPLLGVNEGWVRTGRNLLQVEPNDRAMKAPLSVNYMGQARSAQGRWNLGEAGSYVCTPPSANPAGCAFDPQLDAQARAQIGLLDWQVRISLQPSP